jgi:alpha-mannosidase
LIELPPHRWTKNEIVTDDRGKRLRCQKLLSGELAVLVENVPPFSAERISVKPGNQRRRHGAWVGHAGLSTRTMTLRFGPLTGTITRFYSNTLGRELIDSTASTGANALTYILGTDTSDTSFLHNVNMRSVDNGDLVASLLIQGDLAGADEYACLVRVVDGLDRVDITHWITKTAQRKKEGLHLLFPFEVPNGTRRYDVANSIVRVDSDQLAGVCKNFFSIQSWMDVSNPTFGVTVATLDAPIAEFGEITAEQPWRKNAAEGSTLISYLLNNYWHTNFRADQAGDLTFRYSIYPHLKFDPVVAAKEGKERREPLIVAPAPGGLQALTSVCKLSNDRIICQSIKPTGNGKDCLLFLYNPSNQAQSCSIQWKKEKPAPRVFVSNAFGDSLASAPASIVFAPSSTKYILVAR